MSDKVVKSVGRVFRILELFDRERRPLSGIEVARQLGYPHTSTLALLNSMHALGYMSHDRETWTFLPSQSLPQITEWITNSLQSESAILNLLSDLQEATGETINLSRQAGEFIKIIYGLESTKTVAVSVRQGVVMPINASHTGMVALASQPDSEVTRIIQLLQATKYSEARHVTVPQALEEVRTIRRQQYAPGYDLYIGGIGAVCFPVVSSDGGRPFVVGVVGPTDRIKAQEELIIKAAKKAVKDYDIKLAYPEED